MSRNALLVACYNSDVASILRVIEHVFCTTLVNHSLQGLRRRILTLEAKGLCVLKYYILDLAFVARD
jgi:hypothetical protein